TRKTQTARVVVPHDVCERRVVAELRARDRRGGKAAHRTVATARAALPHRQRGSRRVPKVLHARCPIHHRPRGVMPRLGEHVGETRSHHSASPRPARRSPPAHSLTRVWVSSPDRIPYCGSGTRFHAFTTAPAPPSWRSAISSAVRSRISSALPVASTSRYRRARASPPPSTPPGAGDGGPESIRLAHVTATISTSAVSMPRSISLMTPLPVGDDVLGPLVTA